MPVNNMIVLRTTISSEFPGNAKELSYIEHYSSTLEWNSMSEALGCAGELVDRMVAAGDTLKVTVTYFQRDQ
jgi:hypothetical protein